MNRDDALLILRDGRVQEWNQMRVDGKLSSHAGSLDLSKAQLAGAKLEKADLKGTDLTEANLSDTNLREADLTGASLRWANLSNANLVSAKLSNADLGDAKLFEANLNGANLTGANLAGAVLREAQLSGAKPTGADLSRADLINANLYGANLGEANLTEAELRGAELSNAELVGANLRGARLNLARLVKARLDGATLTDAKLWQTQRSGWSIKNTICERVFWDEDAERLVEYAPGEFELLHAEGPQIELHYDGGIKRIEVNTLPFLVEHLETLYPGAVLRLQSVEHSPGGSKVTLAVDDTGGRDPKEFEEELSEVARREQEVFNRALAAKQDELEAAVRELRRSILDILDQPRIQLQIAGNGEVKMGDEINISGGQVGAVGRGAHATHFQQVWNDHKNAIDLSILQGELAMLRTELRDIATTPAQDAALREVADAQAAAEKGDGPSALRHLKNVGKWALDVATRIGVEVAVEAIKIAMKRGTTPLT